MWIRSPAWGCEGCWRPAGVELCADLLEGGITPSLGMIRQARAVGGIGLHVMIRPRGGDFLFDDDEFAMMKTDIELAKQEGADGVVIGLLKPDGMVDADGLGELAPKPPDDDNLPSRLRHDSRSLRGARDPDRARDRSDSYSGQEVSVLEGLPLIASLVKKAGDRIIIMPGGGITAGNLERIMAAARPREIHFAALEPMASGMRFRREHVFMGGELRPPEYDRLETSAEAIRAIAAKLPR